MDLGFHVAQGVWVLGVNDDGILDVMPKVSSDLISCGSGTDRRDVDLHPNANVRSHGYNVEIKSSQNT